MHEFRLVNDDLQSVPFRANSESLKHRLNEAFIVFTSAHEIRSAKLEVHHRVHGWRQVFETRNEAAHILIGWPSQHYYLIIRNPMTLDYQKLKVAIGQTLAECSRLPTPEQVQKRKERRKEQREKREQEESVQARRNALKLV